MRRRWSWVCLFSVLCGFLLSVEYVNPYNDSILLSELIMQLSGSRGSLVLGFSMHELLSLVLRMVPDFIIEMYLGILMYQHFCTASIYVFSRYPRRVRWYWGEVLSLGIQVMLYQLFLLLSVILISICRMDVQFDNIGLFLIVYHLVVKVMWIFCIALAINLLAIFLGSDSAFLFIMSIQILLITILGFADDLTEEKRVYFLQYNPMSRLVLGWQSGEFPNLKIKIISSIKGLEISDAILQLMILCVIVVVIGAILIKQHDLLCSNAEEGDR